MPVGTAAVPAHEGPSSSRHRSRTIRAASPPDGEVSSRTVAAVPPDQLADDGQPEPAAAGVAVAGLVEPGEPLEDPLPVRLRDARPVVGRPRRRRSCAARAGRRPRPRVRGVPDGVVDQVGQGPAQRRRAARARRHAATARDARPGPVPPRTGRRRPSTSATQRRPAPTRARPVRRRRRAGPAPAGPRPAPAIRGTSARRSAGQPAVPSPSRSATSSWVRIEASGLRSSCAASATNARCRAREAASRSSMELSVTASAWISSPDGGHRAAGRPGRCRRSARRDARSASTGRRAAPDDPPGDQGQHGEQQRDRSTSSVTLQDALAVLDVVELLRRPRRSGGAGRSRRATATHAAAASRGRPASPGTTTRGPASGRARPRRGSSSAVSRSALTRGADHPVPGVDDLDDLAAGDRDRVGQPSLRRPGRRPRRRVAVPAGVERSR